METSLLTTKLFIPPARPGLVTRPRLLERLKHALDYSLVLVSAQAGFGKSTLLGEWALQNKEKFRTAWVSLDEGDNDPVRFWDYFITTLRTLHPAVGEQALSLLHSPQPSRIESVLTGLINDLSITPEDLILVLDDYHLIKSDQIHEGLFFLLEHIPPKMHVVIATRTDPPLGLARLRGRGTMMEIGSDDLRFTLEEAIVLLREMSNVTLTMEDVHALNDRAEGWVVGLKMAALSMRQGQDTGEFIATFTGSQRYIGDYLIEEVLKQQPDDVRDFLLKTSVLERLSAPLCDFITGHSRSQTMLEKMEQSNLFLFRLDDSRRWYRYQHLFAELLRHQLELKFGLEEVAALHRLASQWYEDNSFPDDAIHHSLEARDWDRAMRLISPQSEVRMRRGEWNTLFNWLHVIPDEILRSNPRLYSQYANVLNTLGQTEQAAAALSYLESSAQDNANLQGEVALMQMIFVRHQRDMTRVEELGEKALSLLSPDNLALRARASFLLGAQLMDKLLLDRSWPRLTDASEMGMRAGDYWIGAAGTAYTSGVLWARGQLHRALDIAQQAVVQAGLSPAAAVPRAFTTVYLYELNDLQGCSENAQLTIRFSELGGQADPRTNGYSFLAFCRLALGDIAGATRAIEELDQLVLNPSLTAGARANIMAFRSRFAVRQDDLPSVLNWGNQLSEHAVVLPLHLKLVPERVLIARGQKAAAMKQLQAYYERAVQSDANGVIIQTRVYQSLAAETTAEALSFLSEALTMGEHEGYIRTFVDEGRLLKPLLRQALAQGVTPEYTAKLLTIIDAEALGRHSANREVIPSSQVSGLLSERELEILYLVAAGLSNRQIAEKLIISLSTAKTHVHNISEKLNAKTRTHAVARARELKLI